MSMGTCDASYAHLSDPLTLEIAIISAEVQTDYR